MRETVKLAVRLMIFALVAALLLAVVDGLTKDKIAENVAAKVNDARRAVIGDYTFEKSMTVLTGYDRIMGVYLAKDGDTPVGYVYEMESKGYGGTISLSAGINIDGTVSGVAVSNHSETKGLGSQSEKSFLSAFIGMDALSGGALDVDAMSGATVSSSAIRGAIDEAMRHFAENYANQEVNAQ